MRTDTFAEKHNTDKEEKESKKKEEAEEKKKKEEPEQKVPGAWPSCSIMKRSPQSGSGCSTKVGVHNSNL
jgi:hypothetical protein